jgi:hypothetical protein
MLELVNQTEMAIRHKQEQDEQKQQIQQIQQYAGIDPYTTELVPGKVARIAKLMYMYKDILLDEGEIYISRQEAKRGMRCARYVNDSWILQQVKNKVSIALRENVYNLRDTFRAGRIRIGYVGDDRETEEEDMEIYIRFEIKKDIELDAIGLGTIRNKDGIEIIIDN